MGNLDCNGISDRNSFTQPLSLQSISKRLQAYAMANNIMFQNLQTRQLIEKLFVVGQTHICDKLLQLSRQKKQEEKKQLINDIKKIDLQQFDQLIYTTQLFKQNNVKLKLIDNSSQTSAETPILKINAKYLQHGQNALRKQRFLLIINESNLQSLSNPTDLVSRKSPLQIFKDKIQALSTRYKCRYDIVIICPKKKLQEMGKYLYDNIKIVPHQPDQPCFSSKGKIRLYGNRIQFNESQGDIIHFIMKNNFFKDISKNYDYISFCDVSNFASPAINPIHLGWLKTHQNAKILASLKLSDKSLQTVNIKSNFIQTKQNFGDILIKTQIFELVSKKQNMIYQALASKIVRKQNRDFPDCYYFSRLPTDILYKPFSEVTKVSFVAKNSIEYSNFCKGALGLQNEDHNDLVQVCPSILHGQPSRLQQIKQKLKNEAAKSYYPIIIMKINENQE